VRSWTHAEEEALRYLAPRLSGPELAHAFGRSHPSIRCKACRLHVELGRKSRATNLQQQTPAVLRRVSEIMGAELCPSCGRRAIGVKSTGLCGPCHYDRLREVHEEEIARIEGQRALWAARSKLRRRRAAVASTPEP
jgi:ribosomal protein L34E